MVMKTMRVLKGILFTFCGIIFCFNSHAALDHDKLVDYISLGEFHRETAEITLKKTPPLDTLSVHYDLQLYKINYKTWAPDGSLTIASGLVAMPIHPVGQVGIVSYQHGTRFERNDVPSRNNEKNYIYLAAYGNSAGYMTVMPDYLGLGDNELTLHPYVQAETLASSSIDMLLAAKELANRLHYPISNKLYLAGYSEGGFSTIVMFEMLAKEYPDLPVTAVAPGSAPYGWEETMHFVMLEPGPRATAYLAYFFYALQTYKNYWSNFDEIFVPPYNTLIPELMDGYHTVAEILQALPQNPLLIFQPDFSNGIISKSDRNTEILKINFNHYDFIPTAPLLLVGTKGDRDVPYAGAEMAYHSFRKYSDFVWIKSVSDTLDHVQAHPFVLKEQVDFFKQFECQEAVSQ
ncbi:TPA: alpha/beta hydrolase [Legionella pneumophila]|nr:alpha/beta hydrolase [Legionella pneumophila]